MFSPDELGGPMSDDTLNPNENENENENLDSETELEMRERQIQLHPMILQRMS